MAAILACVVNVACGGTTSPVAPSGAAVDVIATPLATAENATPGRLVDAVSGVPAAAVSIDGDHVAKTSSGPTGTFTLVATGDNADPRAVSFNSLGFISRHTYVRVPGAEAVVSLIPNAFDLASFDQMFRQGVLHRWTNAPPLRVQMRTLQFTATDAETMTAIDGQLSEPEYEALVRDLTWALPQLTGGAFEAFASVSKTTARIDDQVPLLESNVITLALVSGLTRATGFWGYSRWQSSANAVIGGVIMIDADFNRAATAFGRSLRAHELGHALGYSHVTGRASVMNADARTEPNEFDRAGARIAFQRLPGNRSPDVDPSTTSSVNRVRVSWSAPEP